MNINLVDRPRIAKRYFHSAHLKISICGDFNLAIADKIVKLLNYNHRQMYHLNIELVALSLGINALSIIRSI